MSDAAICLCLTCGGVKSSCKEDGRTGTADEAHFWAPRRVAAARFASIYRDFVRKCSLSTIIVAQVAMSSTITSCRWAARGRGASGSARGFPRLNIAGSIPVPIIREKRHTVAVGLNFSGRAEQTTGQLP